MTLTNRFNLPDSIFRAISNDPYSKGDADISTTELINVPQAVALMKRYKDKIQEDVSERIWSLVGQAVHVILERATPDESIAEKRYFRNVLGWKISGAVDLIEENTLFDYKVTGVFTFIYGSRIKEWAAQANVNNWLRSAKWGSVDKLQNVLILRDWVKSKAGTGKYPDVQIVTVDLDLWDLKKAEDYVIERVKLHQEAQKCTDEELAVKFPCSIEDRWLNERTGVFARCESYCQARAFCIQAKRKK